jgi:hypothetical protein
MEGEGRLAHPVSARLSQEYTSAAGRKFGLTVGIAFGVLSGIAWWRGHPTTFVILASVGGALALAGLAIPRQLRAIDAAWMKLALLISKVTTPIFMGIIYFVVLTPIGLLRRAMGKNALIHRPGAHGLWADRSASPKGSLERLF